MKHAMTETIRIVVIFLCAGVMLAAGATAAAGQQDTVRVPRDSARAEAIRLEALIISSTRSGRRIEDEPLRVEVVEREEIEEKLRMTPGDIAMLLNETGGVRVQPTAPSLGGAAVRIQGLRGRYAQLLSDGLPLYGEAAGLGPLQIPPMDLGRVEVIKGAASALYGAAALGGVVNLISRRPDGATELLFNRTTRRGTDGVLWTASDAESRIGWTMMAGVHDQRREDIDGDGWADIPGYTRVTVRPRVFLSGTRSSLMMTGGSTVEERSGGAANVRQSLDTRRFDAGLVGATWLGSVRASVRASAAERRDSHAYSTFTERATHRSMFGEAALAGESGAHTVVAGVALQHDAHRHRQRPEFTTTITTPGVFVQEEWRPAAGIALVASARLDVPSDHGALFSPRVSTLLRPREWSIRASAGLGHHVPTVWIEEVAALGVSALEDFVTLDVERARSASLDIGRQIGAVEVNATLFGSVVDDAVALRSLPDGGRIVENVPGATRTRGAELLARLHSDALHATFSWAWLRATEPDPQGSGRRDVALTPSHSAGLVMAWEDEERGRIGAELYYTGVQTLHDDPYRTRSRPYAVFGVLAERRLGRARVFVNFENIGDVRQTKYVPFLLPGTRTVEPFTTDAWAPLDGRVINAGVRLMLRGVEEH
jgi:outer membrane receptor for ferrienterochelin and colicins